MKENSKVVYSKEEAVKASTAYFNGDMLAGDVFVGKYALKHVVDDGSSSMEIYEKTPDDMHRRLAKEFARIENKYANPMSEEDIFKSIERFKYLIPQGGPMSGIGNNHQIVSISNCFVVGNECDSYGGIILVDEQIAQLQKRRGGVGTDLSHIRPAGTPVKNSAITSTGLVPYMERYSNTTKEVAQDGRRGALMLSLSIRHPDAELFIDAKLDTTKVNGANVSVKIVDEFMNAVQKNQPFYHIYPTTLTTKDIKHVFDLDTLEYDKLYTKNGIYVKKVEPSKLWKKIVHNAWKSAEPGILFWDTIINESVPDCYEKYGYRTVSTNPCAEIGLCPYDSCRLLAVNLYSHVVNPFTEDAYFDFDLFKKNCRIGMRLMDDIVDIEIEKIDMILAKIESDPEPDHIKSKEKELWTNIKKMAINGRRTGFGITAEGDMLAALGIRYASDEGNDLCEEIHKQMALNSYEMSVELAKERGTFPVYDGLLEVDNPFINRIKNARPDIYINMLEHGRRNIALLTCAPTGTTSLMTQTTSGIEPAFLIYYKRRRKINPNDKNARVDFVDESGIAFQEYNVFHHHFITWAEINGYEKEELENMSNEELNNLILKSPYYRSTTADIDWVQKVELQGRVQRWIDHSISVTVNLPNNVTEELVADVYQTGWSSGCKGITVYRDGSRAGVLVSDEKKDNSGTKSSSLKRYKNGVLVRPNTIKGDIHRFINNKEPWIAVVGLIDDKPYELFTGKLINGLENMPKSVNKCEIVKVRNADGKSQYNLQYVNDAGQKCTYEGISEAFHYEFWNYAKLISASLRTGMEIHHVIEQIKSLRFDNEGQEQLHSWKNGAARSLKKYIKEGTEIKKKCENCGSDSGLVYIEGCLICTECGHGKCG